MHRLLALLASAALLLTSTACHTLDDDRIPPAAVNIAFATVAEWNVYGVSGAMDYRVFSREERLPAGYPFLATTHTGYGGVLLVGDVLGNPRAFDRACPVECRSNVRVAHGGHRLQDKPRRMPCVPQRIRRFLARRSPRGRRSGPERLRAEAIQSRTRPLRHIHANKLLTT